MKLSLDWIREFVDLTDKNLDEILQKINISICETEGTEAFLPFLETVVPVKILTLQKHPEADKLQIAKVSNGKSELQVVTAATNVRPNDIVPLVLPGTRLGEKLIQSAPLRGVESYGMFASEKDLGLGEDDSGVWILNSNTDLGKSLLDTFNIRDTIIEIDNKSITHRPDLWSHFGFARELAAQFSKPLVKNPLKLGIQIEDLPNFQAGDSGIQVSKTENAHAYYAVSIEGVKVGPSIPKIRYRLLKSGIKSISNVVDVSNYLLLELGQPTHFFDKSRLPKGPFSVEFAKPQETFPLLDDSSPVLTEEVLLIRKGGEPVAIAGVMGGKESAVYSDTKNLVLESAIFRREDVRRSIRKTGIRSDSSIRYEKGLDSMTPIPVILRACELLTENKAGDFRIGNPQGYTLNPDRKTKISTNLNFLSKKLGRDISSEEVKEILTRLGFSVTSQGENLDVEVPFYRQNYDVTLPEDLVEEIGRTIGYASIPRTPLLFPVQTPIRNLTRDWEKKIRTALANGSGFHEVFHYNFASPEDVRFENQIGDEDVVRIQNEMPVEQSLLRTSIYPSLLRAIRINQDRYENFGLFEIGRTFHNGEKDKDGLPKETRWVGFSYLSSGRASQETKQEIERDFLFVRSEWEKHLRAWGLDGFEIQIGNRPYLHPNAAISFLYSDQVFLEIGLLLNREMDRFDLRKRPIVGKLNLSLFVSELVKKAKKNFEIPSSFPQGTLDLSLILEESSPTHRFADLVKSAAIPELEEVWVHDRFVGGNLKEGTVSVTYRFGLLPKEKTFTQERLKEISDQLVEIAKNNQFQVR